MRYVWLCSDQAIKMGMFCLCSDEGIQLAIVNGVPMKVHSWVCSDECIQLGMFGCVPMKVYS